MKQIHLIIACCLLPPLTLLGQENFAKQLSGAAFELTMDEVVYDPSYFSIDYPNGDIPKNKGVCTDVVIRAYRKLGIDLQKAVHLDMKESFEVYPKIWGLSKTDRNIDHRRVPNLMKFFERKGKELTVTTNPEDASRYLIVHNIGNGQELSDCLFSYKIIGHYSFTN